MASPNPSPNDPPKTHAARRPRILLGITGSVAAVKGPEIAVRLATSGADIRVLLTRGGENFWTKAKEYDPSSWEEFTKRCRDAGTASCRKEAGEETVENESGKNEGTISIHAPDDEWKGWNLLGDPVLHIDLRDWADIAVVAPLSAHTLAKLATGMGDDTLSCCMRAWDFGHGVRPGKPLLLAPAMNTAMWQHPLTKSQLDTVRGFWNENRLPNGVYVVEPQVKTLACGEIGTGALADVSDILRVAEECITVLGIQTTTELCLCRQTRKAEKVKSMSGPTPGFLQNKYEGETQKDRIRKAILSVAKERFDEQQQAHLKRVPESATLVAPISPTPCEIISSILPRINLHPQSLLIDMGCGDGRWLVAAATVSGCRCIGCDLDMERLKLARNAVERNNLGERVVLMHKDVFEVAEDKILLDADVLILYLFRGAMQEMSKILRRRLVVQSPVNERQGGQLSAASNTIGKEVHIISIGFSLPSWTPKWRAAHKGIIAYLYSTLNQA